MHADGTVLISCSEMELQKALRSLEKYCNYWKLNVNIDKTKTMLFFQIRIEKNYEFVKGG